MHLASQKIGIHALPLLVHTQAESPSHFLPFAGFRIALFQRADLEHVRIVPSFAQRRVRKDKAYRFTEREQPLLVLHDQVVGIGVHTLPGASFHFSVHELILPFVDGEISRMCFVCRDRLQVTDIGIFANFQLQAVHHIVVLLLEHIRIGTVKRIAGSIVLLVFGHFVDKKEAQHLNTPEVKHSFTFDMRQDGLPDLDPAKLLLIHRPLYIAGIEFCSVLKSDRIISAVDICHGESIPVLFKRPRSVVQIMPNFYLPNNCFYTRRLLHFEPKVCSGVLILEKVNALQIEIPFCCGSTCLGNPFHRNFLNQLLVVRLHRIQPVDQVIETVLLVCGRITQREQRIESLKVFFGLFSFHRLRFVDDQDGIGFGNHINRPAAAEAIQFHVDTPGILSPGVERLGIDDHHVERVVAGKAVDLGQLGRVIDKEPDLFSVVLGEVFLRDLERLIYPLADGNAWHHDDELAPAIPLVKLVHRLDVGIGLSRTRLHLDGQVVPSFQRRRWRDLVHPLNLTDVIQDHLVRQLRNDLMVLESGKIVYLALSQGVAPVDQVIDFR